MHDETTIEFIVESPPNNESAPAQSKGIQRSTKAEATLTEVKAIPVSAIKGNLKKVAAAANEFLSDIRSVGDFELNEVQLQVEVSAEGGIQFIGTAKAGGKGAITLTFGRPTPENTKAE